MMLIQWKVLRRWFWGGLAAGTAACGGLADESKLPPDVQDPSTLHNPTAAMARYRNAVATLPQTFDRYLTLTGILTDEFAALPAPLGESYDPYTKIDSRTDLEAGFTPTFADLNTVRGQTREARGFLQAYAPDSSSALPGHLYALEGYAEVLLADLFCSGIPLSTVDFDGDFTLAAGSSTSDVYRHAVVLLDSAAAITGDSVQLQLFATVAKGRALLALGQYADAAAAVAAVPNDFKYQIVYTPTSRQNHPLGIFADPRTSGTTFDSAAGYRVHLATPGMANNEGLRGLDYRTSNDPRTRATTVAVPSDPNATSNQDPLGNTFWFPQKYFVSNLATGSVTYTLADGVEARLIEAEAALQGGDVGTWLAKLNLLRETAISPALPDTADPGTPETRVDLLFRERAFWLYLTGHRQGDLRRLVRGYQRSASAVYPTGFYPGGPGHYGDEIVAPVPASERERNPNYTGCIHTSA